MSKYTIDTLSAYDALLKEKNNNVFTKDLKEVKRYINYSDFSNWVNFGSAQLEVNSAIVDIVQDYPDYEEYFNDDTEYIINENGEWSGFFDNNQIEWTINSVVSGTIVGDGSVSYKYTWDDAYVFSNIYGTNILRTEEENPFSLTGTGAYSWRSENSNTGVNFHIYYPAYNETEIEQTIDHTDKDAFYRYTVFVKSNFDYDPGSITAVPGFHFKAHHHNKQYNALMKNYSTETYITPSDTYGEHNQSFFKYVDFSNLEHDSMSSLSANKWYLFVGYYCPRGYDFSDKSVSSCIYDVAEKYKFGDITGIDIRDIAPLEEDYDNEIYDYGCLNAYWASSNESSTGDFQVWNPRVDKLDGNEPSIDDILDNKFYPKNYWDKNVDAQLLWDINQEEDKLSLTSLTGAYGGIYYNFSNSNSPLKKNTEYRISLSIESYTSNWNLYLNERQNGDNALPISGSDKKITIGSDITTGDYSWTFITPDSDLLELDILNATYPTPLSAYKLHLNSTTTAEHEIVIDNISIKEISTEDSTHNKFNRILNENIVSEYTGWKQKASNYSDYILKNELSLSSITATITGTTYGNSGSGMEYTVVLPYVERTTDETTNIRSLVNDEDIESFQNLLDTAESYDLINPNSVINSIPSIITEVNDDLDSMLKIIGHGFDNFLLGIEEYKKVHNYSYKLDEMPHTKILDQMIQNMGFKNIFNNLNFNILQKEMAFEGNNYSKNELEKLIKIFFVNNIMYVLKSKGTKDSIKSFIKLLGWPEELITITEHISIAENNEIEYIYDDLYYRTYQIYPDAVNLGTYNFSNTGVLHFGLSGLENIRNGIGNDYTLITTPNVVVAPSASGIVIGATTADLTSGGWELVDDYEPLVLYGNTLNYVVPQYKLINSSMFGSLTSNSYLDVVLSAQTDIAIPSSFASVTPRNGAVIYCIKGHTADLNTEERLNIIKNMDMQKAYGINNVNAFRNFDDSATTILKNIQFTKQQKITLKSGINPNTQGIFIDDINGDIAENIIRANDLLKIDINPTNIINEFIDNILEDYNIRNVDSIYAKAEDLYKNHWSELRTLRTEVQNFLVAYNGIIDINVFFDVVANGYTNNVLALIKELLIPAKSDLETGIVVESDKLYDKKYAWKEVDKEDIIKSAEIKYNPADDSNDAQIIGDVAYYADLPINALLNDTSTISSLTWTLSSEMTEFKADHTVNIDHFTGQIDSLAGEGIYSPLYNTELSPNFDVTTKSPVTFSTETETYENIYINRNLWSIQKDVIHGHEKQMNELTNYYSCSAAGLSAWTNHSITAGTTRYGKNTWDNSSKRYSITNNITEEIAHKEYSKLVVNNTIDTLFGIEDEGILEITLDRFGHTIPNGNVNILLSQGDADLDLPAFDITPILEDDIINENGSNLTIKLDSNGRRKLTYKINDDINLSANEEVIQANNSINFGSDLGVSGDEKIITNIFASDNYQGEKGNGLKFRIEHDSNIAAYAVSETKNNKDVIIKVIETPYTLWRLRDCLDNKQICNIVNITALKTTLDTIIDSGLTADEYWRTYALGDIILKNGVGKNKLTDNIYKIKINNIYNLEDSIELPITFEEKTNIIDENATFKENRKNNK